MKKSRFTRLTKDMALILFFSAGIPALIGLLMMYHQMRTVNEIQEMQFKQVQEQTNNQLFSYLKNIKHSLESFSQTPELADYLLTPKDLKSFTENRLIGRIETLNLNPIVSLAITDNKKNITFIYPRFTNSPVSERISDTESIYVSHPIQIDDQNLQNSSAIQKGYIFAFIQKDKIKGIFPQIREIVGTSADEIQIEINDPVLINPGNLVLYAGSLGAFMILSICFGLYCGRRRIIDPIRSLYKETFDKTRVLNENFQSYLTENANNELKVLKASFDMYISELRLAYDRELEAQRSKALAKIASQVAHDVRSPLTALNLIINSLKDVDEEKRVVLREATNRINDIANNLLSKPNKDDLETTSELLPALVDSIISEKRIEYRSRGDIKLELSLENSYGIYSNVSAGQFKRILSNLINNSVEAIRETGGRISVRFEQDLNFAKLIIEDNGKGIPESVLSELGKAGKTYGKTKGNGLGLAHAKEMLAMWNGQLEIASQLNKGTRVTIYLQKSRPPNWFVESINVDHDVVVVDDDQSIHEIWKQRLASKNISHIYSEKMLEAWISKNKTTKGTIFLIDHEFLGHSSTGLDMIEKFKLTACSILVTSHYDEVGLRKKAQSLGVKILPKGLSPWVPVLSS